jgi:hypothetical protein
MEQECSLSVFLCANFRDHRGKKESPAARRRSVQKPGDFTTENSEEARRATEGIVETP